MRNPGLYYLLLTGLLLAAPLNADAADAADAVDTPPAGPEQADGQQGLTDVPEPPDIPDGVESGQPLEPQVTITRRGTDLVEEYRLNGRLYKVKITPRVGRPYYLVDNDGDGQLEPVDRSDLGDTNIPQWVLFSW